MPGLEQRVNYETNEVSREKIDKALDSLEYRVKANLGYDMDKNGNFYLQSNGEKLNIPLSQEKISSIIKLTNKIIDLYMKGGHKGNEFYSKEGFSSGDSEISHGDTKNNIKMDLKINNRFLLPDTTFLTDEAFTDVFGKNPSRSDNYMEEYAKFLNKLLGVSVEINKKS